MSQRCRSRSLDGDDTPILRKRVCKEKILFSSGNNGDKHHVEERAGGLSEGEWGRLYERVLPVPLNINDFKRVALEGKLHYHFLAKDLHKLIMELRDILESHGELRIASRLVVRGRKTDMAHAAAAALRFLESERRHFSSEDLLRGGVDERDGSRRVIFPRISEQPVVELGGQEKIVHSSTGGDIGLVCASQPLCSGTKVGPQLSTHLVLDEVAAGSSLASSSFAECHANNEVLMMNGASSPFSRVLHVVKRFFLRFGGIPLGFEVPVQFGDDIVSRRLRLHLAPFSHPAVPVRWPAVKDIVVYVNDQCVLTPWKRSWPERRVEVAKTFLSLDITQFLNRNSAFQKLRIDVFSRDYFSQVALMIVQPVMPEEVVSELVKPIGHPQEEDRDTAIYEFYRKVVEDEDSLVGDVEVDDPVITTKCPILQRCIGVPIRGSRCRHLQCFDCQSFLLSCHKGCYWNCPLCDAELRPRDVVVDTVLWRYLQDVGECCPLYLRLMRKPTMDKQKVKMEKDEEEKGDGMTMPFCWVPYRMTSDSHGVVLDNDDDNGMAGLERDHSLCGVQLGVNKNNTVIGRCQTSGLAGVCEIDADVDKHLGTAMCPIEL